MQVFTALYAGMSEQIKVERNKHHHPPGDRKEWDLWEMWFSSLKKKNHLNKEQRFLFGLIICLFHWKVQCQYFWQYYQINKSNIFPQI